jgi:hypothetical protein
MPTTLAAQRLRGDIADAVQALHAADCENAVNAMLRFDDVGSGLNRP